MNWTLGFPGGSAVKGLPARAGDTGLVPRSGSSPGEERRQPTPVLLPGKFREQKSLVGNSPQSQKSWTQLTDQTTVKLDFIKIKNFCASEDTLRK